MLVWSEVGGQESEFFNVINTWVVKVEKPQVLSLKLNPI